MSRTRTRAMMTAISDRLNPLRSSLRIVGHRNLDMDALGRSVGSRFSIIFLKLLCGL